LYRIRPPAEIANPDYSVDAQDQMRMINPVDGRFAHPP
jgi:hypothetical protein